MRKSLIVIATMLLLAGCQMPDNFRKGDLSDASVQLDGSDKCIVWVTIKSGRDGGDVGLHARIISPECSVQ